MKIVVNNENVNVRLDVFLSKELDKTRSYIDKQIKYGNVLVNGSSVKNGYSLKEDDIIDVNFSLEESKLEKENIPLDIFYEDEYIMVVNKPSGLVVHPGNGNKSHTLVNALMYHTDNLSESESDRPGIVHRIDKDTSGLLLISKTNLAHNILSVDFQNKNIKRKYIALVEGVINEEKGKINAPIGRDTKDRTKMMVTDKNSKQAVTNFEVIERYKNSTLIRCILETGRTHQIRVHMSYIGHPLINDPVYNKKHVINDFGQMLHAYYIGFNHPITKEFMEFTVDAPKEFNEILEVFKNS